MKIDTLKDLKAFIRLCREHGITDVKIDGMEFHLGPASPRPVRRTPMKITDPLLDAKITVPQFTLGQKPNETPEEAREKYNKRKPRQKNVLRQEVDNTIETPDSLTEEELLFYSAGGVPAEEQQ